MYEIEPYCGEPVMYHLSEWPINAIFVGLIILNLNLCIDFLLFSYYWVFYLEFDRKAFYWFVSFALKVADSYWFSSFIITLCIIRH